MTTVKASCPGSTYVSWGIEGDDGPWVVRGECNGPRSCGFNRVLDETGLPSCGGIDSDEWDLLHAAHMAHRNTP